MVSEDPVQADGFLRILRRGALSRHTPFGLLLRTHVHEYRPDAPVFPAYSRLHFHRHRWKGQRFATLGRL
jgi:hypothetical protein